MPNSMCACPPYWHVELGNWKSLQSKCCYARHLLCEKVHLVHGSTITCGDKAQKARGLIYHYIRYRQCSQTHASSDRRHKQLGIPHNTTHKVLVTGVSLSVSGAVLYNHRAESPVFVQLSLQKSFHTFRPVGYEMRRTSPRCVL